MKMLTIVAALAAMLLPLPATAQEVPVRYVMRHLDTPKGEVEVRARRGVVLAAGGFPHDLERRRALFPADPWHLTVAVPSATGDGLRLGESVGGRVDDALAAPGAWCPVSLVPFPNGSQGAFPHIMDRAKPGSIGVP